MKTKKTFDCVQFKRQAQARLDEITRGMSADKRREHLRCLIETGPLADFWTRLSQECRTAPKAGRR